MAKTVGTITVEMDAVNDAINDIQRVLRDARQIGMIR